MNPKRTSWFWRLLAYVDRTFRRISNDVKDSRPTLSVATLPMVLLSCVLYTRNIVRTNFIFDEQEAILANPYVRSVMEPDSKYHWMSAFKLDFWGREPDVTIGSYRPLPNLVWRALWGITEYGKGLPAKLRKLPPTELGHSPWLLHWANVVMHGFNGALVTWFAYKLSKRRDVAWLSGISFVACAVLTEAVSGVVGLSDVMGTLGALLALCALFLPAWLMPLGVFLCVTIGLFSKESALCCVPLVPVGALFLAQYTHPKAPHRLFRAILAFIAAAAAFVVYVQVRKKLFITPIPSAFLLETVQDKGRGTKAFAALMRWFAQPGLPTDRLNNPLASADAPHRIAGALRVYARGLGQVVFPYWLSGDYSSPQEPIPTTYYTPEITFGGLALALPILVAPLLALRSALRFGRESTAQFAAARVVKPVYSTMERCALVLTALYPCAAPIGLAFYFERKQAALLAALPAALHGDTSVDMAASLPPHKILITVLVTLLPTLGLGLLSWLLARRRALGQTVASRLVHRTAAEEQQRIGLWAFLARPQAAGAVIGFALLWIVVSYFPVSNIPIVLPTVRAERFWYFPAIGTSLLLGYILAEFMHFAKTKGPNLGLAALMVVQLFFAFECFCARRHASDYSDDLTFWEATRNTVTHSSKAHLNYSVMLGARGRMDERVAAGKIAYELEPTWPMASVYLGDALCRMHRAPEALPHYKRGFGLGPNEVSLIALGLQCLWDEKLLTADNDLLGELEEAAKVHEGSWYAWLVADLRINGDKNGGVDPKHRPRGYNEGPKKE